MGTAIQERCPECGRDDQMTFTTAQLRSADEGQTIFYSCKCGYVRPLSTGGPPSRLIVPPCAGRISQVQDRLDEPMPPFSHRFTSADAGCPPPFSQAQVFAQLVAANGHLHTGCTVV